MGSYISIHNNTNDTYSVKVGADQAALRIISIVGVVVAAISLTVATAGWAGPKLTVASAGAVVKVMGINSVHVLAMTSAAAKLAGITLAADAIGLATSMGILIHENLVGEEGCTTIQPRSRHSFGRFTLSLWRQGTCYRARSDPNNPTQVLTDTVFMRPIFSGATDNSTLEHDIQFWINKFGHENETRLELSADHISRSDMDQAADEFKAVDWITVYEEMRQKAKQEVLEKEGITDLQEHYL